MLLDLVDDKLSNVSEIYILKLSININNIRAKLKCSLKCMINQLPKQTIKLILFY